MPDQKPTLVLGASPNPDRVSYKAIKCLSQRDIPIIAIGNRHYEDDEMKITNGIPAGSRKIHTITLYLSPENQEQYYDYMLSLKPERIIFNPGTRNPSFAIRVRENGINVIEGCMLVMLKTGQY